jgi:hypothetical protein
MASQLPQFHTSDQTLRLLQTQWAQNINPLLRNPLLQGRLIEGVELVSGDNTINHLLDRKLRGWVLTGISAAAQIYDKQATNASPQQTLILNSDASCTVALWVF